MMNRILAGLVLAASLTGVGCESTTATKPAASPMEGGEAAAPMTRERQEKFTADKALQALREGNERFCSGRLIHRDLPESVRVTGKGQYPFASIVCCLDSRSGPELVFDQGIGDVFCARVAGNIVNEDILGSLEFASKVAGSRLIVVLGHTSCGAVKGACDHVELGNLTALLAKIAPAVKEAPAEGPDRSSKNSGFVESVSHTNVTLTVRAIRERSPILKEMEDQGQIKIVGAMLDVHTGKVSWY